MKMRKQEFIDILETKLSGLPKSDLKDRIIFYSELIDDYIENGLTEDEAVLKIGNVDDIVNEILQDTSLFKLAKEKFKPKNKLNRWLLMLICIGSPIWFSLLAAGLSVILVLYVSLWSVIISLWSVVLSLFITSAAGLLTGIVFLFTTNIISGILFIALALICAGLSIFLYYSTIYFTKLLCKLTKKILLGLKKCLVRKEEA
jgi:uncharacterized membrane protein